MRIKINDSMGRIYPMAGQNAPRRSLQAAVLIA
jgi:hypothetical protein